MRLARKKGFFLGTKEAKNFVALGSCGFSASGPEQKKFLRDFFSIHPRRSA
jgi:hypothetical protein